MSDGFWLTEAQVGRLRPFFPTVHGRARANDGRGLSGIIMSSATADGKDVPAAHGGPKTLCNR